MDIPLLAAVNGPAIGAGCDLDCMCDIRIASHRASFVESFVKVGIVAGDGGSWLLPRVIGYSRAAELAFTGVSIDAATALHLGLVSRTVVADELLEQSLALAARIASNPPQVDWTKRLLRDGAQLSLDTTLDLAATYQGLAHHTADHRQALLAPSGKRAPRFEGR